MRPVGKLTLILISSFILSATGGFILVFAQSPKAPDTWNLKIEPTPERLARGDYLFNHVATCSGCHSMRQNGKFNFPPLADRFAGGGRQFPAVDGSEDEFVISSNITPYTLGEWTDGEIFRATTEGIGRNGRPLQFMPYKAFARIDSEDVYALIAHMRTLSPVALDWPQPRVSSTAPFPQPDHSRFGPPAMVRPAADATSADRGEYLVAVGECIYCHTAKEEGDYVGENFAGGRVFQKPGYGIFRSANITPDLETGIGSWDRETFIARFKSLSPERVGAIDVEPGEPNLYMTWWKFSGMTEEDLGSIYDYLRTVKPVRNEVTQFEPP